eukprot:CAMPEP_0198203936 /NCGR_PEP_ID=MMETSP1445-20131203/7267_1 /TAXON_ID=36898 /ORGANISM="Pyramimonas sp., Strain CCMP2087" /LENGTH=360 /DNA_ID=CAMNT_0043875543 /DNA_START=178 /DNA_END=1257 /DNA_ORIENTATION=+
MKGHESLRRKASSGKLLTDEVERCYSSPNIALRRYAHLARIYWEKWGCTRVPYTRKLLLILLLVGVVSVFLLYASKDDYDTSSCTAKENIQDAGPNTYTVIVNTFKRPDLLQKSIRHYASCPNVDAIRVVWSEQDNNPPKEGNDSDSKFFSSCADVVYDQHPTTSLSNRFRPISGLRTEAVFNVDDDVNVECSSLDFAHQAWQLAPDALVGFIPRLHRKTASGTFTYRRWWTVVMEGAYSIILTKACFMHRDYLALYSETVPREAIDFIDKGRNCEDIAMQFAVANHTGRPPLWVVGRYTDAGAFDGISTTGSGILGHRARRDDCVTTFVELYGRDPLVVAHNYVISAGSLWAFLRPPVW